MKILMKKNSLHKGGIIAAVFLIAVLVLMPFLQTNFASAQLESQNTSEEEVADADPVVQDEPAPEEEQTDLSSAQESNDPEESEDLDDVSSNNPVDDIATDFDTPESDDPFVDADDKDKGDKEGEVEGAFIAQTGGSGSNGEEKGSITIKKVIREEVGDMPWSFDFLSGNLGNFTLTNLEDEKVFTKLDPRLYYFQELNMEDHYPPAEGETGWFFVGVKCTGTDEDNVAIEGTSLTVNLLPGEDVECHFINTYIPGEPEPEEEITVVAHKIVCTDEADLPDDAMLSGWNDNQNEVLNDVLSDGTLGIIDADTAKNWVDSHESCEFVDGWDFEWSLDGVANPGDNIPGVNGGDWNLFGQAVNGTAIANINVVENPGRLWFREVIQDGYIPFTGTLNPTEAETSAEFYCNNDALNYDNWEWIDDTEVGKTYYCVAWNVPDGTTVPDVSTPNSGIIEISKLVVSDEPTDQTLSFEFDATWGNFKLIHGASISKVQPAGIELSVTEVVPEGWSDPLVSCFNEQNEVINNESFVLEAGEIVKCIFTNRAIENGDENGGGSNGGGGSSSSGGGGGSSSSGGSAGNSNLSSDGTVAGDSIGPATPGLVLGEAIGLPNTGGASEEQGKALAVTLTLLLGAVTLVVLNTVSLKALEIKD